MFDLNLSPSDCSTIHALEIQNMDVFHLMTLIGAHLMIPSVQIHTQVIQLVTTSHWRMRTSL